MRTNMTATERGAQRARRRVRLLRKNLRTAPAAVEEMNLEIFIVEL